MTVGNRLSSSASSASGVSLGTSRNVFWRHLGSSAITQKQTLELRLVYHRTGQPIRAHAIVCWLGLLLIRVAEVRTGRSWSRLRPLLLRIRLGSFVGSPGSFRHRSELSQEQKGIYAAFGIAEVTPAAQQNTAAVPSSTTSDQPAA